MAGNRETHLQLSAVLLESDGQNCHQIHTERKENVRAFQERRYVCKECVLLKYLQSFNFHFNSDFFSVDCLKAQPFCGRFNEVYVQNYTFRTLNSIQDILCNSRGFSTVFVACDRVR